MQPKVTIYTDGACNPNPGPGGWAAVLLFGNQPPVELAGSEADTTNNRMELRAALEALWSLKGPHMVDLYTDSQYLRRGVTEWLPLWKKQNWQTSGRNDVKNQDLWKPLARQLQRHDITWHWTRGHANDRWNERANDLAQSQTPKATLPLDDQQAIHVFTAASYLGKQKQGGWGVVLRYQDRVKTLSGRASNTSGNRMHLESAIAGLNAVNKPLPIHLYTTSDYLKDGATLWVSGWERRNWRTKDGKPVSHQDLWKTLISLARSHQVRWHVVSKSELPSEMEQAKQLASLAARRD